MRPKLKVTHNQSRNNESERLLNFDVEILYSKPTEVTEYQFELAISLLKDSDSLLELVIMKAKHDALTQLQGSAK